MLKKKESMAKILTKEQQDKMKEMKKHKKDQKHKSKR